VLDLLHAAENQFVVRNRIGNFTDSVNGQLTDTDNKNGRSCYRAMLTEVVKRVEKRLEALGLAASAASRQAGLSEDAIRNMQRAAQGKAQRRGVSTRTIQSLAPVLQTTASWLLEGSGPEEASPQARGAVPLVGYVGAGATANFLPAGDLGEVEAALGSSQMTVAVEIRGDSLGPLFDRWLVFYDDVRRPVTNDLIGHLCIVGIEDGRVLIKKLKRSKSRGLFHLLSQTEDPILDVKVDWAAKVKEMRPR
jgi:phage repressor protein C with HTH and peptisase S24 domain